MPRQALQAALGRASAPTVARGSTITTTTSPAARLFATSATRLEDDSSNSSKPSGILTTGRQRSEAAAARLAQMSARYKQQRTGPDGDKPALVSTSPLIRKFPSPAPGAVDARVLSSPFTKSPLGSAPKILSFRSLPRKTQDGGASAVKLGLPWRPTGFAARASGVIDSRAPRSFDNVTNLRQRSGSLAGRGRPAGGRRAPGGPNRTKRADGDKKKKLEGAAMGKMTFSPTEKAVIDRLEKGEVVPFQPNLTPQALSGYGPGVASNTPLGRVENVLRTMRLMSGGQSYNADSGVTVDHEALFKRYFIEQKPIFLNSAGEKEWLARAQDGFNPRKPRGKGRRAILDLAVLGKYTETAHVPIDNVAGMISNYHNRTHTYKSSDSQRFLEKVLSLLPAEAAKTEVAKK
ncbi:hypothetical protein QBC35DRAFT_484380 [Podospora australis]|uniref:Uncharacterized protein n=1 Tax=Podospora australis TaxID=1536484 RepID=A0AAN6X245_9PEZI|nr:hypothetical protein QBC35DRAFT_484380 [Podospora australis]